MGLSDTLRKRIGPVPVWGWLVFFLYLFLPLDLIGDRAPIVGFVDDAAVIGLGFVLFLGAGRSNRRF